MEVLTVVIRVLLGALFLMSAVAKFRRGDDFVGAVDAYRLLPRSLVRPVAGALPVAEACLAIALLAGLLIGPVAVAAAALLLLFALAMAVNLLRGRRIDCGCLGIAEHASISWPLVGRNLALALVAGVLVAMTGRTSFGGSPSRALLAREEWLIGLHTLLVGLLVVVCVGVVRLMAATQVKGDTSDVS